MSLLLLLISLAQLAVQLLTFCLVLSEVGASGDSWGLAEEQIGRIQHETIAALFAVATAPDGEA